MRPLVVCVMTHDGVIRQLARALRSKWHLVERVVVFERGAFRHAGGVAHAARLVLRRWSRPQMYFIVFFHSVSRSRIIFQSTDFTSGTNGSFWIVCPQPVE